jgi:anti-sigma B factor antagonist
VAEWGPGSFEVEQTVDPDGCVRLRLGGELDMAVAPALEQRLDELKLSGQCLRLDLSRLEFIDSSGIRTVLIAVRDARRDGWEVEVDRGVAGQVERTIQVLGADAVLWPAPG